MTETQKEIKNEIYAAFEKLGADHFLLCAIGSYGDTLDDREVLNSLKEWNQNPDFSPK